MQPSHQKPHEREVRRDATTTENRGEAELGEAALWEEIATLRAGRAMVAAEDSVLAAIEEHPDEPGFVALLGRIYSDTGRFVQALSCFDQLLDKQRLPLVAAEKAVVLRRMRRHAEAEQLLRTYLGHQPDNWELNLELGWTLLTQRRFPDSHRCFTVLAEVAKNPRQRGDALEGLGWLAMWRGDYQEAQRHFRAGVEIDGRAGRWRSALAAALLLDPETTRHDETEQLCLSTLSDDPTEAEAALLVGTLNFRRGNYPAAIGHLRAATRLDPDCGVDLAAVGNRLGHFGEPERLLALTTRPGEVQTLIERGALYLRRDMSGTQPGEWAGRAIQEFRQALVKAPGSATAAIGLARGLVWSTGDLAGAEEVLGRVLAEPSRDLPAWRLQAELARLLLQRAAVTGADDLYPQAYAVAREAIDSAKEESEPHFLAAVAAYRTGVASDVAMPALHFLRVLWHARKAERFGGRGAETQRLRELARQRLHGGRTGVLSGLALAIVSAGLLVLLGFAYFQWHVVPTVLLGTVGPLLAVLLVAGFLLPHLLKKPADTDVDLTTPRQPVSPGPTARVVLDVDRRAERARSRLRTDRPESWVR